MPLTAEQYDALADAVCLLMGVSDDPAVRDQAKSAAYLVATLAKGYTRGVGFDDDGVPAEEIQSVIITASARLLANPTQASSESESSPFLRYFEASGVPATAKEGETAVVSYAHSGGFTGWTEIERAILHQFRVRAG